MGQALGVRPRLWLLPLAQKSVVVTKPSHLEEATRIFAECKMTIITEGTKYLGTPIGDEAFVNRSIEQKIAEWVEEIKQLSSIAQSEPQAAFATFTHSVASEWLFFSNRGPADPTGRGHQIHLHPRTQCFY